MQRPVVLLAVAGLLAMAITAAAWGNPSEPCRTNISFAVTTPGGIVPGAPKFTQKWIKKNSKNYPGFCFSQTPAPYGENYLLAFSTSQAVFNGFYPTVRTATSTAMTPVSGNGTVTDNYGNSWNFNYSGTATTTTTTTTRENVPYTDTSHTLYLYAYDQQGRLISGRWRTITTRQGGDGANTLGYNLGAALGAIRIKERLLQSVFNDVYKAQGVAHATGASPVHLQDSPDITVAGTRQTAATGKPDRKDGEPDFPLISDVTLVTHVDGEQYLVSAQIGQIDYVLKGPRVDPGRYSTCFVYPDSRNKFVLILDHELNGAPFILHYQIESEQAH